MMLAEHSDVTANDYEIVNHKSLLIFDMIKSEHSAFEIEFGIGNLVSVFFS